MLKEFKEFISKGNVMQLAIGVIIAEAFGKIVTAFTDAFIQPLLGLIGGAEVQGKFQIGNSGQYIDYGTFITAVINFLIVAMILFLMVKAINVANKRSKERLEKSYKPSKVLSGTGAGDTSIAAFLTAVLDGECIEDCAAIAAAEGACCVTAYDALSGLKSIKEIKERIASGWECM